MTSDPIRIRCSECGQLLGVTRKRAGGRVACPRCQAELEVPRPHPSRPRPGSPSMPGPAGSPASAAESGRSSAAAPAPQADHWLERLAAAIPDEVKSLRPEDLRVEAEFANLITTRDPPEPPPEIPPPAETGPLDPPFPGSGSISAIALGPSESLALAAAEPEIQPPDPPVLPGIQLQPPALSDHPSERSRRSEVVLPSAVVLACSLLVLLALPLAFLAGLLTGHYVWKSP